MLSVYYDYQIMLAQRYGGISRYIYEISSRLPALGAEVKIGCVHNHNCYFADSLGMYDMSDYGRILRLMELGTFHYVNRFKRCIELKRGKHDIFHPTYYYASKPEYGKFVVTVHDMTHEKFSGTYPVNQRVIAAKRKIIPQADRIIAVSENTKRDIIEYYPDINPAKITVIYHGASMPMGNSNVNPLSYDYVLFVGSRAMYKNFSRFTQAMKDIMSRNDSIHVFCAGGGAFTPEELAMFGEYSSRFHQAGLSDEELSGAYRNALCFVFPSEYEGFGIPVLEAFACSCPVVCAKSSSLPEVAGDVAVYFDPLDTDSIGAGIMRVLEDCDLRERLRRGGRERLKMFDWDKAAKETLECYKLAVKGE